MSRGLPRAFRGLKKTSGAGAWLAQSKEEQMTLDKGVLSSSPLGCTLSLLEGGKKVP